LKSDFDLFDIGITHIQRYHFEGGELSSFDMVPEEIPPVVSWLSGAQADLGARLVPGKPRCARVFRTLGILPPNVLFINIVRNDQKMIKSSKHSIKSDIKCVVIGTRGDCPLYVPIDRVPSS
jgi:hypothetical protein